MFGKRGAYSAEAGGKNESPSSYDCWKHQGRASINSNNCSSNCSNRIRQYDNEEEKGSIKSYDDESGVGGEMYKLGMNGFMILIRKFWGTIWLS